MEMLPEIQNLVEQLTAESVYGRSLTDLDRVGIASKLFMKTPIPTLELLLPMFFSFAGKPLSLVDHSQFSPLFRLDRPRRLVYKCGRQVGKSLSLAAEGLMTSLTIPNFNMLFVTPLGEQIRRFSVNYVRQLIDNSPFRNFFCAPGSSQTIQQRSLPNGSNLLFSFASMSADRIRGINSDFVGFDEIQDFDPDHLAVIESTANASRYSYYQYSGTPKTLDNTIEGLWLETSQAEWWIPCTHCNEWNIPSLEYHLEEMIGPYHDDISESCPAVVCHKCKKPIFPRTGVWVHRYKERKYTSAGYHIPQILLPMHYADPTKWYDLVDKKNGAAHTSYAKFCNEILGESIDAGQKLISTTDLVAAGTLPWNNNPDDPSPEIFDRLINYDRLCLAVDWAGGGEKLISFTVIALLGILPDGSIECLWGKRLTASLDHRREADECRYWMNKFHVHFIVHDYTGAGVLRETILHASGVPLQRILPVQYVRSASHSLINYVPPTDKHARSHYTMDKTRSLLYTIDCLKQQQLRFFRYDGGLGSTKDKTDEEKLSTPMSLMSDFLALVEEKITSNSGSDNYMISRNSLTADDFAQAVNIGCNMLWYTTNTWPSFAHQTAVYDLVQSYDETDMINCAY